MDMKRVDFIDTTHLTDFEKILQVASVRFFAHPAFPFQDNGIYLGPKIFQVVFRALPTTCCSAEFPGWD